MPSLGLVFFILPVMLGMATGLVLLLSPTLRKFAAYAFLIPTVGALGAWKGCDIAVYASRPYVLASQTERVSLILLLGFILGGAIGSTCGAVAAKLVNISLNR